LSNCLNTSVEVDWASNSRDYSTSQAFTSPLSKQLMALGEAESLPGAYLHSLWWSADASPAGAANTSQLPPGATTKQGSLLKALGIRPVLFNRVTWLSNIGQSAGGALVSMSAAIELRDNVMDGNTVKKFAGAVFGFSSLVQVTGTSMINNGW
jgi:hypothetical protein